MMAETGAQVEIECTAALIGSGGILRVHARAPSAAVKSLGSRPVLCLLQRQTARMWKPERLAILRQRYCA